MSCGGPLSTVMTIAGAGLLPGAGSIPGVGSALGINSSLVSNLSNFSSLPITSTFSNIVSSATGVLGSSSLNSLRTLASSTFPALTNAIPSSFSSALNLIAPGGTANGGFTGLINTVANGIMGDGDLTKFSQVFSSAQGYIDQAGQFLNSNLNIGDLGNTFSSITGGMNNIITGSVSSVTQALGSFGNDLQKLGNLIDMNNLPNLGDPSALLRQVANVGGIVPSIESTLRNIGISSNDIANIAGGTFGGLTNSANKLLYEGMKNITGNDLAQIKNILNVTTPNINTMADLLDPTKILPNSFPTLTMPTPDGLRGIYASVSGAVNTNLEKFLIDPNAPAYTGDDPIVRARLGLPPIGPSETTV